MDPFERQLMMEQDTALEMEQTTVRPATHDDVYAGTLPFLSWWIVESGDEGQCFGFSSEQQALDYADEQRWQEHEEQKLFAEQRGEGVR